MRAVNGGSFGHHVIAAFLADHPADMELKRFVSASEARLADLAAIRPRHGALVARLAEIDVALVGSPKDRRRILLLERATAMAELASLPGERKEATRQGVTATLSALRRVGQLAADARLTATQELADAEADVATRVGHRIRGRETEADAVAFDQAVATRKAIAARVKLIEAIPLAINEAARGVYPNGDIKPADERTWVNAYLVAEQVSAMDERHLRAVA